LKNKREVVEDILAGDPNTFSWRLKEEILRKTKEKDRGRGSRLTFEREREAQQARK